MQSLGIEHRQLGRVLRRVRSAGTAREAAGAVLDTSMPNAAAPVDDDVELVLDIETVRPFTNCAPRPPPVLSKSLLECFFHLVIEVDFEIVIEKSKRLI